jgi:hypothetical protein
MQWASSITSSPHVATSRGSCSARNRGFTRRSGETNSTSTASSSSSRSMSPHSVTVAELIACARTPARVAAATWSRISAQATRSEPAPPRPVAERRDEVDSRLAPPVRCTTSAPAIDHEGPMPRPGWNCASLPVRSQDSRGVTHRVRSGSAPRAGRVRGAARTNPDALRAPVWPRTGRAGGRREGRARPRRRAEARRPRRVHRSWPQPRRPFGHFPRARLRRPPIVPPHRGVTRAKRPPTTPQTVIAPCRSGIEAGPTTGATQEALRAPSGHGHCTDPHLL